MKTTAQYVRLSILLILICGTLFLWGCGNDNPKLTSKTFSIDISSLRQQLGGPTNNKSIASEDPERHLATANSVTDEIKTILVGPVTFRYHCSDYNKDANPKCLPGSTSLGVYDTSKGFTQQEQDQLTDDITQSADMVKFIPFNSSVTEVELEVPEEGLGEWQVFAIGSKKELFSTDDLGLDENDDALTYVGLTKQFFISADDLNSQDITLTLTRGCSLTETPLGCAVYSDNGEAKVTSAVEIIRVEVIMNKDGKPPKFDDPPLFKVIDLSTNNPELPAFPWIVRDPAVAGEITPAQAIANLPQIKPEAGWTIKDAFTTSSSSYYQKIGIIKIVTTHKNSTACQNSADSDKCQSEQT
ncbi:MAG: hypothetical protein HQ517_00105, partial [SAR324 cluster bacterium]|nr:hypothetical protein [SAR324 cluster bacterium]